MNADKHRFLFSRERAQKPQKTYPAIRHGRNLTAGLAHPRSFGGLPGGSRRSSRRNAFSNCKRSFSRSSFSRSLRCRSSEESCSTRPVRSSNSRRSWAIASLFSRVSRARKSRLEINSPSCLKITDVFPDTPKFLAGGSAKSSDLEVRCSVCLADRRQFLDCLLDQGSDLNVVLVGGVDGDGLCFHAVTVGETQPEFNLCLGPLVLDVRCSRFNAPRSTLHAHRSTRNRIAGTMQPRREPCERRKRQTQNSFVTNGMP